MIATYTVPHTDTHVYMLLCIRDGAKFRTQVGICTCTDACTHIKTRCRNRNEITATYTVPHTDTHVYMSLCIGDAAEFRTQVGINTCTDACIHSIQVEGTQMR